MPKTVSYHRGGRAGEKFIVFKSMNKNILIGVAVVFVIAGAVYYYSRPSLQKNNTEGNNEVASTASDNNDNSDQSAEPIQVEQGGGLKVETINEGTGSVAKSGDRLKVHYVGTLANGTKFDSSRDRQTPFDFTLGAGQVIAGWDQGMIGMKVGEIRKLTIPPELGYGSLNMGAIPPNSTLIFEVELLKIN